MRSNASLPRLSKSLSLRRNLRRLAMRHDYEQLFSDLAYEGLKVNNLFQLQSGTWRCNLRVDHPGSVILFNYGEGPDPYLATIAAWAKLSTDKGMYSEDKPSLAYEGPRVDDQIAKTKAQRLLATLGLKPKPKPKYTAGLL